jgi:hypothetical protein
MRFSRQSFSAFLLLLISVAFAQAQSPPPAESKEARMNHAIGPFDVKVTPLDNSTQTSTLGRFILNKQYHGDLEAKGDGQMLSAGTNVKGSGAYVAIERVTGTLNGRSGSFTLQHTGMMTQGKPNMTITVVLDSGTDKLTGISGSMKVNVAPDGKHTYDFEYALPNAD